MKAHPAQSSPRLTGRHVLIGTVAFFGTIFAVNGYMLYAALSTHAGIVAAEPYRKGLAYNDRIRADERQIALGWTTELTAAMDGTVAVRLRDDTGMDLAGRTVTARLGRPATSTFDRAATLREVEAGHYSASVGALSEGTWTLDVEVRDATSSNPVVFRARKRLWLKH